MSTIYQPFVMKDREIYINGELIDLHAPIKHTLLIDDLIIYCLKIVSGAPCNRNVGALSYAGELIWKIPEIQSAAKYKHFDRIHIDNQGRLIASNYNGPTFIVDHKNGEITSYGFEK